jgi:hypothetical protein
MAHDTRSGVIRLTKNAASTRDSPIQYARTWPGQRHAAGFTGWREVPRADGDVPTGRRSIARRFSARTAWLDPARRGGVPPERARGGRRRASERSSIQSVPETSGFTWAIQASAERRLAGLTCGGRSSAGRSRTGARATAAGVRPGGPDQRPAPATIPSDARPAIARQPAIRWPADGGSHASPTRIAVTSPRIASHRTGPSQSSEASPLVSTKSRPSRPRPMPTIRCVTSREPTTKATMLPAANRGATEQRIRTTAPGGSVGLMLPP